MAITTISQLPALNTSLSKVGRASVAAAADTSSTKQTGLVVHKNDLLELTLRGNALNYAYFSSKISIAELHANMFGKLQSQTFYNGNEESILNELVPLSYNKSSYYKNGDRIFYLADQTAPLRVLRFIGSKTQTLEHDAPNANNIVDYVSTVNVNDVNGNNANVNIQTDRQWMYDTNTLNTNIIPLFAPMLVSTKLYNSYWIEATHDFVGYYSIIYAGLGKILQTLISTRYLAIGEDNIANYLLNETNPNKAIPQALKNTNINGYYLHSMSNSYDVEHNPDSYTVEYESYKNLNIVIFIGTAYEAMDWLKQCYDKKNIEENIEDSNTLNFWTIVYDTGGIEDNMTTALPKFVFIPPRVYNNQIIATNDSSKFLYFYCGNEFSNNNDGIDLAGILSALNNKENKLVSKSLAITKNVGANITSIEYIPPTILADSPIYNNNGLNIRYDDAVFSVTQNEKNEPELTISNALSSYIIYTRALIVNSVEQINNILNDPDEFDASKLTTASLTNS